MLHACQRTGGNGRRQRCRENKAGCKGADGVHEIGLGGDVAAHNAEGFCQCTLDNVDACHQPFAVGNAATAWPVHAHGMHFVKIGEGIVFFGQIANFFDRRNVAIHRIDGFKNDKLGALIARFAQQAFQMFQIIMPPDAFAASALAHALNHRGVVQLVRQYEAIGQQFAQR